MRRLEMKPLKAAAAVAAAGILPTMSAEDLAEPVLEEMAVSPGKTEILEKDMEVAAADHHPGITAATVIKALSCSAGVWLRRKGGAA